MAKAPSSEDVGERDGETGHVAFDHLLRLALVRLELAVDQLVTQSVVGQIDEVLVGEPH
jgi:hypothetical protein